MCVAIDPECKATVWASLLFINGTLLSGLKRMDSADQMGNFFVEQEDVRLNCDVQLSLCDVIEDMCHYVSCVEPR